MPALRTVAEHQAHIQATIKPLPSEKISIHHALGRTLATDAVAQLDLPPWDNSAMDGYAIQSADSKAASEQSPVTLPVRHEIPAGATQHSHLSPGTAAAIMTGAPVPEGADTVVPIEDIVGYDPSAPTAGADIPATITLNHPVPENKHIRRRAEDITAGQTILPAGTRIQAHQCAALAASGIGTTEVARTPTVAVIATGDELIEPGHEVGFGQIPDSNSVLVSQTLRNHGISLHSVQRVSDRPGDLEKLLAGLYDVDAIIVTGGASVGAHDVSKQVLDSAGVDFVTVKMQPGKPQGFGTLGQTGPSVWVLPGNPVSVLVSLHLFVIPGLRLMQNDADWRPAFQTTLTAESWTPRKDRDQYIPVRLVAVPGEALRVAPASSRGSGSHLAARMAWADGMVHIPAQSEDVSVGEPVNFLSFSRL